MSGAVQDPWWYDPQEVSVSSHGGLSERCNIATFSQTVIFDANGVKNSATTKQFLIIVIKKPRRCRIGLERSPRKRKVECSNPNRDRLKSLKQVVTAPLPNARQ